MVFRLIFTISFVVQFFLIPWAHAAGIFNDYDHSAGDYSPTQTVEIDRTIQGHQGLDETLSFRISLYGTAGPNLPLLVQVHEWGGNFAREEELASYVPDEYSFVMLYFQYKPSTNNEDDWWFGTHWGGQCHMWAHDAVMGIVREAVNTSLVSENLPGVTIDANQVYLFGHSIGGTGAWQLGVRNPDIFAAVHAHSGYARFDLPEGLHRDQFERDIVGGDGDGIVFDDGSGRSYPARDYSNLAWWLANYRNAGWDTPFMAMTAGMADDVVLAASGADLMRPVFDQQLRAFFYNRHSYGHSEDCYVQMNWLAHFRLNQSFLAFTNRSGYGVTPDRTGYVNDLTAFSWDPATIVDRTDHYEVRLEGSGTADVTLRRLQNFQVTAGGTYLYWLDARAGSSNVVTADADGLLTIPAVSGAHLLIIEPSGGTVGRRYDFNGDGHIDMLYRHPDTGRIGVWFMDGLSETSWSLFHDSSENPVNHGAAWDVKGVGDFNGDGQNDVVFKNSSGAVGVWLMNGVTEITWSYIDNHGDWDIRGVADLNNDGSEDVIYRHPVSGNIGVWFMNGVAEANWQYIGNHGTAWNIKGVGDLNGDGHHDILYKHSGGGIGVWIMNGANETAWQYIGNHGTAWDIEGVGDYNSDGHNDILYRHSNGNIGCWLMNGLTETTWHHINNHGPWDVR